MKKENCISCNPSTCEHRICCDAQKKLKIQMIQDMQDSLPDYIDREYPKGNVDREHPTVHITKFLLDFKKNNL
jgi:hypothetical protein